MNRALVVAAAAALALPATARAAEVIDTARAKGDFAIAIASGTVADPGLIKVRVTPSPRQKWTGNWNMVCSNDEGAGSKQGSFSGRRARTITLRKPMRDATSCTVAASASLSRGGRIRVQIIG